MPDNRLLWAKLFTDDFQTELQAADTEMQHFSSVLHFYLAFETATGRAERALGVFKEAAGAHNGETSLTAGVTWVSVEMHLDGPTQETTLFEKMALDEEGHVAVEAAGGGSPFLLTAFSRSLAQYWIKKHGRRFHTYKVRKDCGVKRGPRKGSENHAIQAMSRARRALAAGKGTCKKLLGCSAEKLMQKDGQKFQGSSAWNKKFAEALTLANRRAVQRRRMAQGTSDTWRASAHRVGGVVGEDVGGPNLQLAAAKLQCWSVAHRALMVFYACEKAPAGTQRVILDSWKRSDPTVWLPKLKKANLVVLMNACDLEFSDAHGFLGVGYITHHV